METPNWQIAILLICGLASLVSIFGQFIIVQIFKRLNRHSDRLDLLDHDMTVVKTERENKAQVEELRTTMLQSNFDAIEEKLNAFKEVQDNEVKKTDVMDNRLTDFIIQFYKGNKS